MSSMEACLHRPDNKHLSVSEHSKMELKTILSRPGVLSTHGIILSWLVACDRQLYSRANANIVAFHFSKQRCKAIARAPEDHWQGSRQDRWNWQ